MTPKEIATEWFTRVWKERSKEAIHEFFAADAMLHKDGAEPAVVTGPDAICGFHDYILATFPDLTLEVRDVVADETQACVRWEVQATQNGPFGVIPPTNEKVNFTGTSFFKVANGKITEAWDHWDRGWLESEMQKAAENQNPAPSS